MLNTTTKTGLDTVKMFFIKKLHNVFHKKADAKYYEAKTDMASINVEVTVILPGKRQGILNDLV